MTTPTIPPAPTTPPITNTLEADRNCIKCSYNLLGLPLSGACPECGTPVADSLRGILLQFASKEYIATVRTGLNLVLFGILLQIVIVILGAIIGASGMSNMRLAVSLMGFVPVAMIILGYWKYTQPDPQYSGIESPNSARKILRIAVLVSAGSQLASAAIVVIASVPQLAGSGTLVLVAGVAILASLVSFAAWAVQFFACMRYTLWMSRRIPDYYMTRRTQTYLWLLPLLATVGALIIIGPLIALVLYWNLLDRLKKHVIAIEDTGLPANLPGTLG